MSEKAKYLEYIVKLENLYKEKKLKLSRDRNFFRAVLLKYFLSHIFLKNSLSKYV